MIGVLVLPCCVPIPTATHLGRHHEPMGSDSDGDDYESLATLLAVAIAAFARKHIPVHLSSRTRTAAVCEMSLLLMHEVDESEGEDSPPRVKRRREGPFYKASFA